MPDSSSLGHVYINCPFDGEYRPLFEALVFAVQDCGFVVRCALELDDGGQVRIDKIGQLIEASKFGIHDISRTELDPAWDLPRFNMPLELGLFLGAKRFGSAEQREKLCLILDRARDRYQRFCSNIAGQDIKSHNGDPRDAVKVVRNWLRNPVAASGRIIPGGSVMVERYARFQSALPLMCADLRLDRDDLLFNDFTTLASEWLKVNPW